MQGITPLHEAAFRGSVDAALFFLQHNADPNLRTLVGEHLEDLICWNIVMIVLFAISTCCSSPLSPGETPLHYAVRSEKEEIVRMLLAYRGDPHLKSDKQSPLERMFLSLSLFYYYYCC